MISYKIYNKNGQNCNFNYIFQKYKFVISIKLDIKKIN